MRTIHLKGEQVFEPALQFPGQWKVALQELSFIARNEPAEGLVSYEVLRDNQWVERTLFKIDLYSNLEQIENEFKKHIPWKGAYRVQKSGSKTMDFHMPNNGTTRLHLNSRMQRVFPAISKGIIQTSVLNTEANVTELEPCLDTFIHADFIKPYFVAGRWRSLLRMIPIQHTHTLEHVHFEPKHLEWHSLILNEITCFKLEIYNNRNEHVRTDGDKVSLTLVFKQAS